MKNPCFSGPARIHICLCLHSAQFQQELAVKLEAGKKVPLQPSDVCAMTGVSKKHFRQYMNCLEASGLAKCEGLTKGRVLLYCYAVPRPPVIPEMVPRDGTIFESLSPEIVSLLKHYRIKVSPEMVTRDGTIEKLQRLAEAYKEIGLSLRECLNGPGSGDDLNKEEIQKEEEIVSLSVSSELEEAENDRLTDIAEAIPEELQDELQQTPSYQLLTQIDQNLSGAPVASLTQKIIQRRKVITSLGILPELARDVGDAYIRTQIKSMATTVNGSPPTAAPVTPEMVAAAIYTLQDPESPPWLQEDAKNVLEAAGGVKP